MKSSKIQLVMFDCDGVMFDTAQVNRVYYNRVLDRFNLPRMTDEQFAYVHMHTVDESMIFLFSDREMLDAAQAYRKELGYTDLFQYMVPEPHLKPLLEKLRPVLKAAVVTNRSDTMHPLLKEFDLSDSFDMVVTSLDVKHPKPHPEGLVKVLRAFDIPPHEAVYIGDSKVDELAARAASVPLAAYDNPSLSADYHLSSLKDMAAILDL